MHIAIFGKSIKKETLLYFDQIVDLLTKANIKIKIFKDFRDFLVQYKTEYSNIEVYHSHKELTKNKTDILFSIGGDGTLLETINHTKKSNIPVFGINLGRMGFLSSCGKETIPQAINKILNKEYSVENRSMLSLICEDNHFKDKNFALNEFSIIKIPPTTMIKIHVWVDDEYLNYYLADGLLIATPTGSTAYSMSCGGPIVTPESKNFIITPIASHNLTVRPVVIPDDSVVKVKVDGTIYPFLASLDSHSVHYDKETVFEIKKSLYTFPLIRLNNDTFFQTLREKLMWGIDIRN